MRSLQRRSLIVALALVAEILAANSAGAAEPRFGAGSVEVSGQAGFLSGVTGVGAGDVDVGIPGVSTGIKSSGSKWNAGGGVAFGVNRFILITGEVGRERFGQYDVTASTQGVSASSTVKANVTSFTAGVQLIIPTPSPRFSPYATVGGGLARLSAGASVPDSLAGGLSSDVTFSETDATTYYGGGVRLYLSKRFGIRPELRAVHVPGETYLRTSVGVFYQFK